MYKGVKYSGLTNRMVHQVLLDPSGSEITVIYKNWVARRFRGDDLENTFLNQSMVMPATKMHTPL